MRYVFRATLLAAALLSGVTIQRSSNAQDTRYAPRNQQIPPPACLTMRGAWEGGSTPCSEQTHRDWLNDVTHWRAERRIRIGYDAARYELPALKWAQSSFIQPQMMVHDRYFFDPATGKYTVDR
jgi:hypothetical protein